MNTTVHAPLHHLELRVRLACRRLRRRPRLPLEQLVVPACRLLLLLSASTTRRALLQRPLGLDRSIRPLLCVPCRPRCCRCCRRYLLTARHRRSRR